MHSLLVKFLSLFIVCIEILGGEACHEEEKRQSRTEPTTTTGNTPTGAGEEITFVNVGIPIIAASVTAAATILSAIITRYVCCRKGRNGDSERAPLLQWNRSQDINQRGGNHNVYRRNGSQNIHQGNIHGDAHQGGVPTLRDLCILPVSSWYILGLQLGISGDELDVIERMYPRDDHMCKVKMFGVWLRVDASATYEKLARALAAIGKRTIAEAVCTERGLPLTVLSNAPVPPLPLPILPPPHSECVARYAQYLKDKYKRMSTLPDGDWPPSIERHYTRLAMIEREERLPDAKLVATMERDYIHGDIDNIVKRKKAIELSEMFLPTEYVGQQLKILMDGAPGVGKSTLSRKVCKDWASGELLQQYNLVVLLSLRQASIREATSIEGLIDADDPNLKQQIVQHIQENSGEHLLLILDGYDELAYEQRTQNSLFLEIIRGNMFSKCSVLVTSRPYASDYLQQLQSVNRHIEVLGFTEKQIEHCIMENIPDKAKATELVQTLKERQDIASLCYIPLNCAIVLYVYEKEQCTLPHCLTNLYETFILNALKRHAKNIGKDPKITRRMHTVAALPEPFQKQLSALSKLAYDGLVTDKMIFSIDHLEAVFPDCGDLDRDVNFLGLMTVFKEFTSTGEELSYQFLHLTIQEFLAARWAASQFSADELKMFCQNHVREVRYRMILLFLAGILQHEFTFADELDFQHSSTREFFFLCHLIYESQNFNLFHSLAKTLKGQLSAVRYSISPFDCLLLAYFLSWSDCKLELLDLSSCGLTNQSLEIIHRVNLEHCGTTQIKEVDLSCNPKILTKLSLLSKLPVFEHVRRLTVFGLQYPEGVSSNQVDLYCLLNMRHLTTLEILVQGTPETSYVGISLSLNEFELRCKGVTSQNAVDVFRSHISLKKLDLSGDSPLAKVDTEAVGCAIESMLNINRTLRILELSGCRLDTAVVTHIAVGLTHNDTLTELYMGWNGSITSEGWVHVFMALHDNTSLKKLDIRHNNLGLEGSVALAEMSSKTSLIELNLQYCVIPEVGLRDLARGLLHNTTMKNLDISNNNIGMEGFVALAEMLSCNKSLIELNFACYDIPEAGLREIVRGLLQNTSLQTLWLEDTCKVFIEVEIERLNQSLRKLEIKTAVEVLTFL